MILDEPTAALDPLSEAEIYEHFDMLVQGKTTLYISHRMSSCKFCDRIIVMEQGEVEEEGTHDTLPVSYTHLDVYKRQSMISLHRLRRSCCRRLSRFLKRQEKASCPG